MKQSANKWCTFGLADLFDQQTSVFEDVLELAEPVGRYAAYVDTLRIVNDAILYHLLQLLFGNTKSGLNFVERVHEVRTRNLDVLNIVESCNSTDLTLAIRWQMPSTLT